MSKEDGIRKILEDRGFTNIEIQWNEYTGEYSFTSKQINGKMYLGYSLGAALYNASRIASKKGR